MGTREKDVLASSGLLDYGARLYDPALARWISVDPLAEKAYDISTYAYCMNTPLNIVDLDGRRVSPRLMDRFYDIRNWIESRKSRHIDQLKTYNDPPIPYDDDWHDELLDIYDDILALLDELMASDTYYDFKISNELSDKYNVGGVVFDPTTGGLTIIMPEVWDEALLIHELVHCGQFEDSEVNFASGVGNSSNWLYDMFDEEMAYKVQEAVGGTFPADWRTDYMRRGLKYEDLRIKNDLNLQIFSNHHNQVFKFNGKTYMPDHIRKAIENN